MKHNNFIKMFNKNLKNYKFFLIPVFSFVFILASTNTILADKIEQKLSGKILLQVEENGEAWYVNPDQENKIIYLRDPLSAFNIMRFLGIGATSKDLDKIPVSLDYLFGEDSDGDGLPDNFEIAIGTDPYKLDTDSDGYSDYEEILHGFDPLKEDGAKKVFDYNFAKKQSGRILLQVEKTGEAWYINPDNFKRYYLGGGVEAFALMRNLGLGISNSNLAKLKINQEIGEYYMHNQLGFSVFIPETWKGYKITRNNTAYEYNSKSYDLTKINFHLPIKISFSDDEFKVEDCPACFEDVFSLYIFDRGDYFFHFLKDLKDDPDMNLFDELMLIGENSNYMILRPKNLHGQAYNGEYMRDRINEAITFLDKIQTFNVK